MRVAIDTNGLYVARGGVARYIRGLIKGIRRVQPVDLQFFEFAWEVENFGYRQPARALKTFYREFAWAKATAPVALRRHGTELLHSTATMFIDTPRRVKNVLTLHDLAFLVNPMRFRRWQRWSWRQRLRRLPAADRIICVSQFTADEVIRWTGVAAKRLVVVYNGCEFHAEEAIPVAQAPAVEVPSEFLLFVGSLEPGKNLSLLRAAYLLAERNRKELPPLVVVGARWEGVDSEGSPPKNWVYLGRQPDAVLVYLYQRTLALVFPSQYEGFGLPLVEAMALRCPVICSPVSSLPEVGGDAVYYAEQTADSYLQAMETLSQSQRVREELITKGVRQAAKFSWRRCAEETMQVYRQVLAAA